MLPSACSFIVSCHCLTLHVSAYMATFKCVGYFYFHIPEGICFAGFLPLVSAYMAIFKCVGYFLFHMPEGICFAGFLPLVSAYMAIFKCVGYFYFHILEGICFAGFFAIFWTWSHCTFPFVCVCKKQQKN
jgi:hypothetical protein